MPSLSDYLNSINVNKNLDIYEESSYNKFAVNRCLMRTQDSLFRVSILNKYKDIDGFLHYMYLLKALPKRKRFGYSYSKVNTYLIETLMKKYNCNYSVAKDYAKLLETK